MKKYIILPLLFISTLCWGQAQFVVQNGSKTEVYTNINTAINSAAAGDTLYIPGGGFTISNPTIDKTLHWVGHGHYPDSTRATMQSRITSSLNFTGNCDNSSFEGIFFTNTIQFGDDGDDTENVTIKRCRFNSDLNLRTSTTGTPNLNFQIRECVLSHIRGNNASNCQIEKSLLFGLIYNFVQSEFTNNHINADGSNARVINSCSSCTFVNNVFAYEYGLHQTSSCTFNNNIFAGGLPFYPPGDSNGGNNNIIDVGTANMFTAINGNITIFNYTNDYHLNASATGTLRTGESGSTTGISIINFGTDGTNCGIYGTNRPYKTIPYYPHINTATIDNEASNNQLGVQINVQAQDR